MLPGVGIVGNGKLVTFLVPCLRAKGFLVEGLWSFNLDSAIETANQLDIPFATDSVDQLLLKKEVQLVVVACPPHLHATIVSKAFNIGKHVVCGWPASLSSNEMKEMVERATYYPSLISILAHPLRFVGAIRKLKELLNCSSSDCGNVHDKKIHAMNNGTAAATINGTKKQNNNIGMIGTIKMIDVNITGDTLSRLGDLYTVKCDHNMGGGLLTTVGSHVIDTISFITRLRAKRVNGTLRSFSPSNGLSPKKNGTINRNTIDDYCSFQLELDQPQSLNGSQQPILVSVVINSNIIGTYSHEMKVIGTKGYLIVKGSSLYCYKYSNLNQRSPTKESNPLIRTLNKNQPSNEELIFEEVDETLNALNLNSNLPCPYDQGMVKLISTLSNAFSNSTSSTVTINEDTVPDSSYSSATSSLNSAPDDKDNGGVIKSSSTTTVNSIESKESGGVNYWFKDAVNTAASFEDGQYIQAVIEAVKLSNERREWIRVKYNSPFGPNSPVRKNKINQR